MFKNSLFIILLGLFSSFAMADDGETVTIGGTTVNKQATVITFSGDNLTLTYSDGSSQTTPMDQANIAFNHVAHLSESGDFDNLNTIKTFGDQTLGVRVTRTLRAGQWAVVCFPFNLDANTISTVFGSGSRVASLKSITGTSANFATCAKMSAGIPYIVCPANEVKEFTLDNVLLHNLAEGATVAGEGFDLTGSIVTASPDGTVDYIAYGNQLKALTHNGKIKALHGFFSSTSETPSHLTTFTVDGETIGSMAQLTGDVNADKTVNITDIMLTVNSIIGHNPVGFNAIAADMNGDGTVNITDVMTIVNIVIGLINTDNSSSGSGSDIAVSPSNIWDN